MHNNTQFIHGSAAGPMASPYPMPNHQQFPSLMQQAYMNQVPPPLSISQPPRFYHPRPPMQASKPEKRKQEILTCDACGIEVNSQQMMDVHIRGQKHIKKMKLKSVSGTNFNPSAEQGSDIAVEAPQQIKPEPTAVSVNDATSAPPPAPAVVKPPASANDKSVLQMMNELAKFHKINAKYDLVKETGPPHCKQFEVRLTFAEEAYTGIGTSIKRAQQVAAEQALAMTVLKKPEAAARGSHFARLSRGGTVRADTRNATVHDDKSLLKSIHPAAATTTAPAPPFNPPQQIRSRPYGFRGPVQHSSSTRNETKFQDVLEMKCAEIIEEESTTSLVHSLVEDIERALKTVSDKIMELCQMSNTQVVPQLPEEAKLNSPEPANDDPTESFRMLKGSMKVSILAMRLFLKLDRQYSLVLICANKPNVTLLNDICQELSVALNTQAVATMRLDSDGQQTSPTTYQVEKHITDACLQVQCSSLPEHTVRIMMTSPVFRSENYLHLNETIRQQIVELNPDPLDMLDKNKCLEAAAEIRHSNWFTHCMLENQTNLMVLRLLRDLQYNQTPLAFLNLWSLALLVHKCQSQPATSITDLFRSVFVCLSSGILLPNFIGPGIIDPCEKEPVDAAAYLSIEQRLSITAYAQSMVRFIAFEQYDHVFPASTNPNEQVIRVHSASTDHPMV